MVDIKSKAIRAGNARAAAVVPVAGQSPASEPSPVNISEPLSEPLSEPPQPPLPIAIPILETSPIEFVEKPESAVIKTSYNTSEIIDEIDQFIDSISDKDSDAMTDTPDADGDGSEQKKAKKERKKDRKEKETEPEKIKPEAQYGSSTGNAGGIGGNIFITSPDVPFHYQEAFHFLRTNIKYLSNNKQCRKIVVTSSIPCEGKSSVAINLALTLSSAGHSVVLIDTDLRMPKLHLYLDIPDGDTTGLTSALQDLDNANFSLRACAADRNNMFVVPCGIVPLNPAEVLGSGAMKLFIDKMAAKFDYVIMDTPPVSVVTDAAVLSQFADGVLMVVRQKMVTFDQARRAKKNLEDAGATILGAVLNDFDAKHTEGSGRYYYGSYYSRQY